MQTCSASFFKTVCFQQRGDFPCCKIVEYHYDLPNVTSFLEVRARLMALKPWVEKYRPKDLDDVAHQETAVAMLHAALSAQSLPHLLFYGPPGTGKTSVALIVARRLFRASFKTRVLELNASDDRGIDVVRRSIKGRASRLITATDDCPPFQLIILDEADCMTADAQKALLRTMEVYSRHTRFIIICNYVSRIIGPLVSRCARIRFQSLPREAMKERIDDICRQEGVQIRHNCFELLAKASKGDLRRAIMLLQSAVRFGGNTISTETLCDVTGYVPDDIIAEFEKASAKGLPQCLDILRECIQSGYSGQQILIQFAELLFSGTEYNDIQKGRIFEIIAQVDHRLATGSDEALQLMLVGAEIMNHHAHISD